jgi:hypothetical protein
MMRTNWRAKALVALACAAAVAAAACADKSPWGLGTNVPAAGATAEGVGFSVLAENYTADLNYIGPTVGDSVSVGLAVAGVRQGNVVIQVTDSLGTLLWQQLVVADTARGQTYLHGKPPYHLRMEFLGFSGVLSIGVGVKAP